MAEPRNQPIFREVQKWDSTIRVVFLALLLVADAGMVAAILAAERKPSDTLPLAFSLTLAAVVSLSVIVLLWVSRLEIEVRPDAISVRFFPFHLQWRQFPAQDLRECYARRYRPLREYGGWGIRYGWHGWAYNLRGHEGVQLVFQNGRKLLLGSQQPQKLETAIRSIMKGDFTKPAQDGQ
jgi:hypothetical protein